VEGVVAESIFDKLSDEGMAYKIRMLTRSDLDHEMVVVAARDRILKLASENLKLRDEIDRLRPTPPPPQAGHCPKCGGSLPTCCSCICCDGCSEMAPSYKQSGMCERCYKFGVP
jgi:hypothetical protein